MTRIRDSFDLFGDERRARSSFGDNEFRDDDKVVKVNLCDLDLYLHNDNPQKQAIAVSLAPDTPFARWAWLARSLIEYEKTGVATVRVTLPERVAKDKGLV